MDRSHSERRSPHGDLFLSTLGRRPASFSELAGAVRGQVPVRVSEVVQWIAQAESSGLIEPAHPTGPDDPEPRRVRLTDRGRQILSVRPRTARRQG